MLLKSLINTSFKLFNFNSLVFVKGYIYIIVYINDLLFIKLNTINIKIIKA
jgi:hypothetical protein